MEDDYQPITSAHYFYSLLAFVFVWGSLWVGTSGVKIARSLNNNIQNYGNQNNLSAIADYNRNLQHSGLLAQTIATLPTTSTVKILISGDLMLDRGVRLLGEKYGYDSLFATVTPLFKNADIVVANLEGPITYNKSKTVISKTKTGPSLQFTFDPKATKSIADSGITVVSLANNHIDNFGLSGIQETKKWLSENNIQWFGDYRNSSSTELIISKNGINIAFVGYHAFQKGFERVVGMVKELHDQGNFVIVMPHWGEEYASTTTTLVRAQARELVVAGADAIVGSHPHVVQEKVWMGDVPVIYSLGNLLFDQYFSKDVMRGNIVEFTLEKSGTDISIKKAQFYETSIASKRGIDVDLSPVDF
jgi:poly-gamma-glutamate synthesis protein (capsule biosynthesis protein)